MQFSIQKLAKSQLEIKIVIPLKEFENCIEKTIANLGKDLEIAGFRKGQAPRIIIEREIGQEKIFKEAAENCIKENYLKVILENKIEPIGQSEVEILKLAPANPFEFKVKISVLPEVKLPDYKKIASQVKKEKVEVTEEEIERLKEEKERIEKERVRQEILEKIIEKSEMEIPEILVELERKRMLENLKEEVFRIFQMEFEDYLVKINKSQKELLDSLLPEAQKKVKIFLALKEIEKKEKIEASEKEIAKEVEKFSQIYPHLDQNQLKSYAEGIIKNEKTLQMLENFSVNKNS